MSEKTIFKANPYNLSNKLLNVDDINDIMKLVNITDFKIKNLELYQKAFVHKSYSKKNPLDLGEDVVIAEKPEGALELFDYNSETLEFFGDSVLGMVVAKYLMERFPNVKIINELINNPLISGGISGSLSWLATYPIDTIKTQYQSGKITFNELFNKKLLFNRNNWNGFSFCITRAFLVNSISFYCYDKFKNEIFSNNKIN